MRDAEIESSFPQILFVAFTLLVLATTACSIYLFYRLQSTIHVLSDVRGPVLHQFVSMRSNSNNAVQECFAYVVSGHKIEKEEFDTFVEDMERVADDFREMARLDARDLQDFDEIIAAQANLFEKGRNLIAEFESEGRVSLEMFDEFEQRVDEFDERASAFEQRKQGEFDTAKREAANALNRTHLEIAGLGIVSLVLVGAIFYLLIRSFRNHNEQQAMVRRALRSSEQRFRQIFENEPQCVKLLDAEGRVVDMNAAGLSLLDANSIEDVQGKCVYDFIAPQDREHFVKTASEIFEGESRSLEFDIQTFNGTRRHMESREVPLRDESHNVKFILAITQDVTERRETELALQAHRDNLAHVSRVNMMGELASNIAHELNQPLAAATNFASALEATATGDNPQPELLAEFAASIREQAARAAEIVRGLRRLVDRQTADKFVTSDLNAIIQTSFWLLEPEIRRHRMEFHEHFQPGLPSIHCDEVQIQQVLLNLVRNAIEAMEGCDAKDRHLLITTLSTDETVELRVQDHGHGLKEGEIDSMFDAFYTTKPEGMGMGLAVSRSIAEAHHGTLTAEAGQPQGTILRLILPTNEILGD